jgi:hypothetical protein
MRGTTMKMACLVLKVDGPDTIPIGVYADVLDARDAILERERGSRAENGEFLTNLEVALEETSRLYDVQFESGFGSYDYRLCSIEVNL